jgi:hypothetical protein
MFQEKARQHLRVKEDELKRKNRLGSRTTASLKEFEKLTVSAQQASTSYAADVAAYNEVSIGMFSLITFCPIMQVLAELRAAKV